MTAAYAQIDNGGRDSLILVGFRSDVAESTDLHETVNRNGMLSMEPRPRVAIAPGGTLTLKPGSYHLMLNSVVRPLANGDSAHITLHFSNGDSLVTVAHVREP